MTFDVIVVGTGAGGATVAKELSKEGLDVLVLEKGQPYKAETAVNHLKNVQADFKNSANMSPDMNSLIIHQI